MTNFKTLNQCIFIYYFAMCIIYSKRKTIRYVVLHGITNTCESLNQHNATVEEHFNPTNHK